MALICDCKFAGLALISMGISVMQEQIVGKITWCAGELGITETEEDRAERYILTLHPETKATPAGKTGNHVDKLNPKEER